MSQKRKHQPVVAKIESGIKMRLDSDSELARLIYLENFERSERQFLASLLRRGDIFVDVGANIGLYALTAARCVGKQGEVYAFEPCAETYGRLLDNIKLNGFENIFCYPMALSDASVETEMTVSMDGYDAWNSLASPISGERFRTEKVSCTSWDHFAKEHDLVGRVTMMKIDVEGWESRVLKGALSTLSRDNAPILQVEFEDRTSLSGGSSCNELYCMLENLGYQMFVYHPDSNTLIPDPVREQYAYANLIAAKQTKFIEERFGRF